MSNMIERDDNCRSKFGRKEDGTEAGHKMSYDVTNAANKDKPGPKGVDQEKANKDLNDDQNLRIKSHEGNQITNRENDQELAHGHGKRFSRIQESW
mmetsp:Transcript_8387/g.10358  ORF Transcript_8387/g.10358 Transcript_8387/m.10358 type:complete len:96 (-) Transcript_8387:182-469(-)